MCLRTVYCLAAAALNLLSRDDCILATPTCMAVRNQRYCRKCVRDDPCVSILGKINGAGSVVLGP